MRYIILVFYFLFTANVYSQSVISSAGKTSSGDHFIISWTVGEVAISTIKNSEVTLTQGFHQPLVVDIAPTGIEKSMILEMKAFPNPTFDKVIFEGGDPVGIYHVRVVDKLGRVLEQKSLPYQDLVLEMSRYENGTYLVEVVEDDSGKRKIFNIIKSYK